MYEFYILAVGHAYRNNSMFVVCWCVYFVCMSFIYWRLDSPIGTMVCLWSVGVCILYVWVLYIGGWTRRSEQWYVCGLLVCVFCMYEFYILEVGLADRNNSMFVVCWCVYFVCMSFIYWRLDSPIGTIVCLWSVGVCILYVWVLYIGGWTRRSEQ